MNDRLFSGPRFTDLNGLMVWTTSVDNLNFHVSDLFNKNIQQNMAVFMNYM